MAALSSPSLSPNETLSSPPQMAKSEAHITPVKRRSSARLSRTPQQSRPSLTDSPIPVLTPPTRAPERRETPRKTPRSIERPTGVTKLKKTRPVKRRAALTKAYAKDETRHEKPELDKQGDKSVNNVRNDKDDE